MKGYSDFIWPFLPPYRGTFPNQKMVNIFPILCILGIIFPKSLKKFHKYKGKSSFPKSQIKSLGKSQGNKSNIGLSKIIECMYVSLSTRLKLFIIWLRVWD